MRQLHILTPEEAKTLKTIIDKALAEVLRIDGEESAKLDNLEDDELAIRLLEILEKWTARQTEKIEEFAALVKE